MKVRKVSTSELIQPPNFSGPMKLSGSRYCSSANFFHSGVSRAFLKASAKMIDPVGRHSFFGHDRAELGKGDVITQFHRTGKIRESGVALGREDDQRLELFGFEILFDIPGLFVKNLGVASQSRSIAFPGLGHGDGGHLVTFGG